MKTLIKNAVIVDKDTIAKSEILIENGLISKVADQIQTDSDTTIIDAKNKTVMPAFVDLHVHFRDPGFTYKEDLQTGSKSAVKGGYTTVNLMANTNPICDSEEKHKDIITRAEKIGLVDIYQAVAVTENFDATTVVDYSKLSTKLLSDDGKGVPSDVVMYHALKKAKENDKLIMVHAESELSKIDYRYAEDLITMRDLYLAEKLGAPIHFCHVSTIDAVKAIQKAKEKGVKVTCEIAPHHISLYDLNYRVNPPIRSKTDVQALIEAVKLGVVDTIGTDHAPHTEEDKENGAPGMVGLETAFCVSYTSLVKNNGVDIRKLSELLSYGGAKILGINKGLIKQGYEADLVIVDTEKEITVDPSTFASKSKNTPFAGKKYYGQILATIKKGEIKYKEENF
ncbi:dihydroorotase [Actinomyces sp. zg-332]|uniref:dihydroorotase n=1 Tax=Actinomyces sp. zg-332 TaxID=2708340 RepID=UPI00141F3EDC|nr:dihydroorotase [Actinomyces sp. zg-332]QPK93704.1 dihydroorotase [Actinomyces sp. zg-332]